MKLLMVKLLKKFWDNFPYVSIAVFAVCFVVVAISIPRPIDELPSNITPNYKTVESGFLGSSQYYIFDTGGNRYFVTQALYDKYKELPKE